MHAIKHARNCQGVAVQELKKKCKEEKKECKHHRDSLCWRWEIEEGIQAATSVQN